MKSSSRLSCIFTGALLLDLASIAVAHGGEGDITTDMTGNMDHGNTSSTMSNSTEMALPSYFRNSQYSTLMLTHIVLMSAAWIFVLPLSVMLSIVRSKFTILPQLAFLAMNTLGVLFILVYNGSTFDMYPNNAHHTLGWLLFWIVCAQSFLAFTYRYFGNLNTRHLDEQVAFLPISTQAMEEYSRMHGNGAFQSSRFSDDSGQGTERNTESLRSQSLSSVDRNDGDRGPNMDRGYETELEASEKFSISMNVLDKFLRRKLPLLLSFRTTRIIEIVFEIINRLILVIGFVALTTGIVTYAGIFRGVEVFSGLAHFIKGGIFFWYGILTLGRWAGCFADFGWAWNIKPSKQIVGNCKASIPSAEFVESFLIFFYGSTNVFLEHLGSGDGVWSAQDLEHVSITIMFLGGGLCGMLIESSKIRDLLNASIVQRSQIRSSTTHFADSKDATTLWETPRTYRFSMNPLPALVVLLLGLMMSSHHQASMVSTMIHKQWGTLLIGAAFSRAATYIIFFLSPPTSLLPSRPPSELITAFCLMAGGLIFMASSHDIVVAMEFNNINAMFVFTITMGLVSFLMAWIILVIAIKGWASRRENRPGFVDRVRTT